MKALDLKGERFGKLVAIEIDGKRRGYNTWNCLCDCGRYHSVSVTHLKNGYTKSCGCYSDEIRRTKPITHNSSKECNEYFPEYRSWALMKRRCYNPNDKHYFNYGGRGITVCDRWLNSFENFLADMGKKPSKLYSLDRKEGNGIYEPSNCRWATKKEQAGNRRTNRWIEHAGRKMILQGWADYIGVDCRNLSYFLKKHTMAEAISKYKNQNVVSNQ